jgi:hypothetical protein
MQNNNPSTEIGVIMLSIAIIAAMTVLLALGKIDYVEAVPFLTVVAGLFGVNAAIKAPSPAQQQQLLAQHQSLQSMLSQVLQALPALFQQAGTPPPVVVNNQIPAQPVAPVQPLPPVPMPAAATQPQVQQQPLPAKTDTFEMPVVPVQP